MQVRQDWGIKESVGQQGWQGVMRHYLRQDRQAAAKLVAELAGEGCATPGGRRQLAEPCVEGTAMSSMWISPAAGCADQQHQSIPVAGSTTSLCPSIGQQKY